MRPVVRNRLRALSVLLVVVLVWIYLAPDRKGLAPDREDAAVPAVAVVSATLDEERAVTEFIPVTGGTVEATAADGSRFTLIIPPGALAADVEITLTPITALDRSPVSGARMSGVDLAPDGLRLYEPATLIVAPAEGTAEASAAVSASGSTAASTASHSESGPDLAAAAFTYEQGASAFYQYPLELDPSTISLRLNHFSGYLVYTGENLALHDDEVVAPTREQQIIHEVAELARRERDAIRRGEPGDPDFGAKLATLHKDSYREVIEPLLQRMTADCALAKAAVPKALAWAKSAELLLEGSFAEEIGAVFDTVGKAVSRCERETWEELQRLCEMQGPQEQAQALVRELLAYERLRGLISLEGAPPYGSFDQVLEVAQRCGPHTLVGTITHEETYVEKVDDCCRVGELTIYTRRHVVLAEDRHAFVNMTHLVDATASMQVEHTVSSHIESKLDCPSVWESYANASGPADAFVRIEFAPQERTYQVRVHGQPSYIQGSGHASVENAPSAMCDESNTGPLNVSVFTSFDFEGEYGSDPFVLRGSTSWTEPDGKGTRTTDVTWHLRAIPLE